MKRIPYRRKTSEYKRLLTSYNKHVEHFDIHLPSHFVLTDVEEYTLSALGAGKSRRDINEERYVTLHCVHDAFHRAQDKIRALDLWAQDKEE